MKIKELIKELENFDPEKEVLVESDAYYDCSYLGPAFHVIENDDKTKVAILQEMDENAHFKF